MDDWRNHARMYYIGSVSALPMTNEDRAASIVLEAERDRLGMPKAELTRRANAAGLSITLRTVNYYLDGERSMTIGAFRTLHTILGLSREEAARRVGSVAATLEDSEN